MRYLRLMLLPFSWLFGLITSTRNKLYESGIFKSITFDLPIITIGNLTVGGTGKTPMIEYLIRLLKNKYRLSTLSRGYKRKSRGNIIASNQDNALTIGDEPFQLYLKFKNDIYVSVGEDRAYAIPHIIHNHDDIKVLLLDDAFQHRQISPSYQILISDYNRLFFKDFLLPTGYLRESRKGAKRANVIIVTKCPQNISSEERLKITNKIHIYSGKNIPVYFTYIHYDPLKAIWSEGQVKNKMILITGIANPDSLVYFLQSNFTVLKHFKFADHHYFTSGDIKKITNFYDEINDPDLSLVFTEKDIVRIVNTPLENKLKDYPVFYIPITYKFVEKGMEFDNIIIDSIEKILSVNRK